MYLNETARDECNNMGLDTTIRLNHEGCSAGEDTKRRLYLTRHAHSPGITLAYCHNCSEGAAVKVDQFKTTLAPALQAGGELVPRLLGDASAVSELDLTVLTPYEKYVTHLRPVFDAHTGRLNFPIFDTKATYVGYNSRAMQPGVVPKYVLNTAAEWDKTSSLGQGLHLVIVEDMVSMSAIGYYLAGNVALCIYGCYINPMTLNHVLQQADPSLVTVWLDNDNPQVTQNALNIKRTISMLSSVPCRVMHTWKEPKHYSNVENLRALEQLWT